MRRQYIERDTPSSLFRIVRQFQCAAGRRTCGASNDAVNAIVVRRGSSFFVQEGMRARVQVQGRTALFVVRRRASRRSIHYQIQKPNQRGNALARSPSLHCLARISLRHPSPLSFRKAVWRPRSHNPNPSCDRELFLSRTSDTRSLVPFARSR